MRLNRMERLVVNNPLRVAMQQIEMIWFLRAASPQPKQLFLEIGCGRGAGARILLRKMHPARIDALDLDFAMVKKAKGFLTQQERARTSLCVGDSTKLPFKSAAYDILFGFGFLHHVPDWKAAIQETARVLKPGGRYYLEELYPPLYLNAVTRRLLLHPTENRFDATVLKAAMEDAGFILESALESWFLGILGVAVKRPG